METPAGNGARANTGPVGVLALQGSFPLHTRVLNRCGVRSLEVRKPRDLEEICALIIPGGESTVMAHLARKYELLEPMRELGREGLPMFGTCAGAVLLGRGEEHPPRLDLVDVEVLRNAYGRQVDSFTAELTLELFDRPFHGVFIRAPKFRLRHANKDVRVLGHHEKEPVLLESGSFLLSSFHPELTDDLRIHQFFLERCAQVELPA